MNKKQRAQSIKLNLDAGKLKLPSSDEFASLKAEWETYVRKVAEHTAVPAELFEDKPPYRRRSGMRASISPAREQFEHRLDDLRGEYRAMFQHLIVRILTKEINRTRAVQYLMWRLRGRQN